MSHRERHVVFVVHGTSDEGDGRQRHDLFHEGHAPAVIEAAGMVWCVPSHVEAQVELFEVAVSEIGTP